MSTNVVIGTIPIPGDVCVALTYSEYAYAVSVGAEAIPFHDLVHSRRLGAATATVSLPARRGFSFARYLEWLVTAQVVEPGGQVTWIAPVRGGASFVARLLEDRGWKVRTRRKRGLQRFEGNAPAPGNEPKPRSFAATIAGKTVRLLADWGSFSAAGLDNGTQLLLEAARVSPSRISITDVGTGYGSVAIGLALNGTARRSSASEIDSVALYLAIENARCAEVDTQFHFEPDAKRLPLSDLTVCNFPTHLSRNESDALFEALLWRAAKEETLIVVHRSLADRFRRKAERAKGDATAESESSHTVLRLRAPRRA